MNQDERNDRRNRRSAVKQRALKDRAHYGRIHDLAVRACTDNFTGRIETADGTGSYREIETSKAGEIAAGVFSKPEIKRVAWVDTNNPDAFVTLAHQGMKEGEDATTGKRGYGKEVQSGDSRKASDVAFAEPAENPSDFLSPFEMMSMVKATYDRASAEKRLEMEAEGYTNYMAWYRRKHGDPVLAGVR